MTKEQKDAQKLAQKNNQPAPKENLGTTDLGNPEGQNVPTDDSENENDDSENDDSAEETEEPTAKEGEAVKHAWTLEFLRDCLIAQFYRLKFARLEFCEKYTELATLYTIVEKETVIGHDCGLEPDEAKNIKFAQFKKALNTLRYDESGDDYFEITKFSETSTIGDWRKSLMELLLAHASLAECKKLLRETTSTKTTSLEKVCKKTGYYSVIVEKPKTNAVGGDDQEKAPETFANYIASHGAYKVAEYANHIFNTINKHYTALYGSKTTDGNPIAELELLKIETAGLGDEITPKTKDAHLILVFKNSQGKTAGLRIQVGDSGAVRMVNGYCYCDANGKMLKPTPAAWANTKKSNAWQWVSDKIESQATFGYRLVCEHLKKCFEITTTSAITPTEK